MKRPQRRHAEHFETGPKAVKQLTCIPDSRMSYFVHGVFNIAAVHMTPEMRAQIGRILAQHEANVRGARSDARHTVFLFVK